MESNKAFFRVEFRIHSCDFDSETSPGMFLYADLQESSTGGDEWWVQNSRGFGVDGRCLEPKGPTHPIWLNFQVLRIIGLHLSNEKK